MKSPERLNTFYHHNRVLLQREGTIIWIIERNWKRYPYNCGRICSKCNINVGF